MKGWVTIGGTATLAVPWLILRVAGFHGSPVIVTVAAGAAILGAAFLLSWIADVLQLDISQGLAVALLAFIAVLPEYSVDMYFAWQAGQDPAYSQYAMANMTGANRLLIGIGWAAVMLVFWLRTGRKAIFLDQEDRLELSVLCLATIVGFVIAIRGEVAIYEGIVLLVLFGTYIWATLRQPIGHPNLEGPAESIGRLPVSTRRAVTGLLFCYAGVAIVAAAAPFADGLVESGKLLNVDQFILVQWLAPVASEAPEFIVAGLFAFKGHGRLGIRTMISSKVNQWTLLVGMLPMVYAASAGGLAPLSLDTQQAHEVLLTAAQSTFAIFLLAGLSFSLWGAGALGLCFAVQLVIPETRLFFTGAYLVLSLGLIVFSKRRREGLIQIPHGLLAALTGTGPSAQPKKGISAE